jgi:hypothetical protein
VQTANLRPSGQLSETEWLAERLSSKHQVSSIVPAGFAAYVRIFHPAMLAHAQPVTWSDVARRTGGIVHPLAQFHALSRIALGSGGNSDLGISAPESGNLSPELLKALCELLGQHTSTADSCWFCIWEGNGWIDGVSSVSIVFTRRDSSQDRPIQLQTPLISPDQAMLAPVLRLPNRNYYVFEGHLDAARNIGYTLEGSNFLVACSPNLFWPKDRAWCVATEVDLFCTIVAGSETLAESLVSDGRLEAWCVSAHDLITSDSDRINL